MITHGILIRGAQGAGGELGHMTIRATGPRCVCGNRGCREVAAEEPNPALGRLAIDRRILGEDVTRLAREGDGAALSVLEEAGVWLGIGLAGYVNIFNPGVLAVGGWASAAGGLILDATRREVHLRARSPARDLLEIKEANPGPESGVPGAAARDEAGEYVLGT